MNRHLFDKERRIMAIIMPDGSVTFHNEKGFKMTQEEAATMLRRRGYTEAPL